MLGFASGIYSVSSHFLILNSFDANTLVVSQLDAVNRVHKIKINSVGAGVFHFREGNPPWQISREGIYQLLWEIRMWIFVLKNYSAE